MNNYIYNVVKDCAYEQFREPREGLPKGVFEKRTHRQWAVSEILSRLYLCVDEREVIESFIKEMEQYARISRFNRDVFVTARSVGLWALDIINALL